MTDTYHGFYRHLNFIDKHPPPCPHHPARWKAGGEANRKLISAGWGGRLVPIWCFPAADKRRFRQEADRGQRASFRPLRWAVLCSSPSVFLWVPPAWDWVGGGIPGWQSFLANLTSQ